jgi:hypothetical protein
MPYTVFLGDTHVAHLYRQEIFHDRLPYTTVVHILVDAEDRRFKMVIDHLVEPRFLHVAEVGSQVLVTQELTPDLGRKALDRVFSVGVYPD